MLERRAERAVAHARVRRRPEPWWVRALVELHGCDEGAVGAVDRGDGWVAEVRGELVWAVAYGRVDPVGCLLSMEGGRTGWSGEGGASGGGEDNKGEYLEGL